MFYILMILLILLSITTHIMIGVLYQKLMKETEKMEFTENSYLQKCKAKFSNYYLQNTRNRGNRKNGDTNDIKNENTNTNENINVMSFVEQYFDQEKIKGMPIPVLSHLSGQALLLAIFLGGLGACKGIINGATIGELLPYYIISLLGLYVYFSIMSAIDVSKREAICKRNVGHYLESNMIQELEQSMLEQEEEKMLEKELQLEMHTDNRKSRKVVFTKSEEQELENLLKEFLA